MLYSRNFSKLRLLIIKKSFLFDSKCLSITFCNSKNVCDSHPAFNKKCILNDHSFIFSYQKRWNSKSIVSEILSEFQKENQVNDVSNLTTLFPQPKVTLYEFAAKRPEKTFDIIYKQSSVAPKGGKKSKVTQKNDWTCIYAFVWPKEIVFESTAKSKKQAADKAATLALQWLYTNGRIDHNGLPLYDKTILKGIKETLNEPINVAISEKSIERITRIYEDYENGIKSLFINTHNEQLRKNIVRPYAVKKDSTIEEEDASTDEELGDVAETADILEQNRTIHPVYGRYITEPSEATMTRRNNVLTRKFETYYDDIIPLPINEYRENVTSAIRSSRALVLVGAAGCGKSTRAPAFVLGDCLNEAKIIVSEPRRVAAIGLATSVAAELGEEVGETVGYQVRLHSKPPRPPGGSILFCTSGVLLRRLQLNPGLEGCSHVFIDEAHERDVNTDITLLLLKRALELNPELKVIIMSATLESDVFTSYFKDCPLLEIPGRAYPVTVTHLEDLPTTFENLNVSATLENCRREGSKPQINFREVVEVIRAVDASQPEGAILVFLPGWTEIKNVKKLLDERFGQSSTHIVLPVHSRLSTADQAKMFTKPLPGVRKIVLATNIAETSITIRDAVYVIDSGAHKENRTNERTGIASLETVWVSHAAAKQRTGRAGRVQPGHCYRLYTKEKENEFVEYTTAEILRIPLEQTVLDCKSYAPYDKVEDFLSQLPEPPSAKAIAFAVRDLVDLGALTMPEQNLTALGHLLLTFTLPPRLGCALLYSVVFGNVVSMSNIVTQLSANVEVFENAVERREDIRNIKRQFSETSDHAALHWLQDEYEQIKQSEGWKTLDTMCQKNGLRKERLKYLSDLSRLHLGQLLKSGIVENEPDTEELNRFADLDELIKATLLAACNSLLVTRRVLKTKGKMAITKSVFTSKGDRAHIGTESVNHSICKRRPGPKMDILACFGGYHCTERRALVVHKTSLITPHTALLFCKGDTKMETSIENDVDSIVNLPRHNLRITIPMSQADHLMNLREILWNTLQYYTERDTRNLDSEVNTTVSRFRTRLVKTIGRILVEAEREHFEKNENFTEEGES